MSSSRKVLTTTLRNQARKEKQVAKAMRFHVDGSDVGLCIDRQIHVFLQDGVVYHLEKCDGKCQEDFDLGQIVSLTEFLQKELASSEAHGQP